MRIRTDAKRQQILEVARAAFLRQGYAATSMTAIAAAVGGSKSTLYGYFPSKELLFGAVVHSVGEAQLVPAFAVLEEETELRTALTGFAQALIRFLVLPEEIACLRLVLAEAARFPELGRAFHASGPARGEARLAAFLQRQVAEGRLRPADPLLLSQHFSRLCEIGPHKALLFGAAIEPAPSLVAELAEFAVDAFLRAHGLPEAAADDAARAESAAAA